MTTPEEIFAFLQKLAPLELAESWDNPGLLVDCGRGVNKVLVCLDITDDTEREARKEDCGLIVSHHPVIFTPLKSLCTFDLPAKLLRDGISAVCMHTNLDAAEGGVNDTLARLMDVRNTRPFGEGMGRVGEIESLTASQLAEKAARVLHTAVKWADAQKPIRRLALVSGAGGSLLNEAVAAEADALLTGEANHHQAHDALHAGLSLVAAGHFATEFPVAEVLAQKLRARFPELEVQVSRTDRDPFCYRLAETP